MPSESLPSCLYSKTIASTDDCSNIFIASYPFNAVFMQNPRDARAALRRLQQCRTVVAAEHNIVPNIATPHSSSKLTQEMGQDLNFECRTGQRAPLLSQAPNGASGRTFARIPTLRLPYMPRRTLFPNVPAVEPNSRSLCRASIPFKIGMLISVTMTSGLTLQASDTNAAPSAAVPTTSK
jgi:hypothetical protein